MAMVARESVRRSRGSDETDERRKDECIGMRLMRTSTSILIQLGVRF
jgi:hypothetical protein